jgi:hypothetical protein
MKLSVPSLSATTLMKSDERGAIGYIVLWLLGVPASILFLIFLMRGCT